ATVYGVPPPLAEGQRLAAELRLYPSTGLRNPGTFDYAEHLKREGIRVTATARADRLTPLDDPVPPWPARIKHESLAAISRALPPTSGALLAGLLLGERTDLPHELDEGSASPASITSSRCPASTSRCSPRQCSRSATWRASAAGHRQSSRSSSSSASRLSSGPSHRCCAPSSWRCSSSRRSSWSATRPSPTASHSPRWRSSPSARVIC